MSPGERPPASLPTAYFDGLYADNADPWGFASRWYEHRKYAITLASLPKHRYHRALEVGCSIGVLTEALATRCAHLLAVDASAAPLAAAAARLHAAAGVELRQARVPEQWPAGSFDLVVLSEVCYYLSVDDLDATLDLLASSLRPGGDVVAVHWRPATVAYPQLGDDVHARLRSRPGLTSMATYREESFALDVLRRS